MNNRTETMPTMAACASASIWTPRLFRATFIVVCAVSMFGWIIALSWAAFSFLGLVLNQFT